MLPAAALFPLMLAGGEMRGKVMDAEGDPVQGAVVVLECACMDEPATRSTDEEGRWQFAELVEGRYTVRIVWGGARQVRRVTVGDAIVFVPVMLTDPAGERRRVTVGAGVRDDTTTATVVDMDEARHLPVGSTDRDFTGVVDLAPTATRDAAGIRLAGTSGAESKYVVDGANVTSPVFGTVGASIVQEFVETVEIQEAGYLPEYGGVTGGVVTARRVSGTNQTRGVAVLRYTPRLGRARTISGTDEAIRVTEVPLAQMQAVALVAGPIVRDQLFYSVGISPSGQLNDLNQSFHHNIVDETGGVSSQKFASTKFRTGKVAATYQGVLDWVIQPGTVLRASVGGTPRFDRTTYRLPFSSDPTAFGTNPAIDPLSGRSNIANGVVNDHFGWNKDHGLNTSLVAQGRVAQDKLEFDLGVGYGRRRQTAAWRLDDPGLRDLTSTNRLGNQGLFALLDRDQATSLVPGLEEACNDAAGPPDPCPVRAWVAGGLGEYDDFTQHRAEAHADLTHFFELAGPHQLKYGAQFEHVQEDSLFRYSGHNSEDFTHGCPAGQTGGGEWCFDPRQDAYEVNFSTRVDNHRVIQEDWFSDGAGTVGFGRVQHERERLNPIRSRIGTPVRVPAYDETLSTQNYAAFVQDRWMIAPGLQLMGGVRWDIQGMRDLFGNQSLLIWDSVAPRVGATYDWTQQGRSRLFASYGHFYQTLPLLLNNRVFGGLITVVGSYPSAACRGGTTVIDGQTHARFADGQPTEWCNDVTGRTESGSGIGAVVPRLRGMYNRQLQLGYEHELIEDLIVRLSWLHTSLARGVEDVSVNGGRDFLIANPGLSVSDDDLARQEAACAELEAQLASVEQGITARDVDQCRAKLFAFERASEVFDAPKRVFDAWTLNVRKRFADNWMLLASYTYSRLRGNYDGFVDRDTGAIDIGQSDQYDLPELVRNSFGPLNDDRPHLLKLDGYYTWRLGQYGSLTFGTSLRLMSGTPLSFRTGVSNLYTTQGYLLPRGLAGRLPPIPTWNLSTAYSYPFERVSLEIALRVLNVTNTRTVIRAEELYSFEYAHPIPGGDISDLKHARAIGNGGAFYGPSILSPSPNFRAQLSFQQPVSGQAEIRLMF